MNVYNFRTSVYDKPISNIWILNTQKRFIYLELFIEKDKNSCRKKKYMENTVFFQEIKLFSAESHLHELFKKKRVTM